MAKRGPKGPWKYTESVIDGYAEKLNKWIREPNNFWLGDFAVDVCDCDTPQLLRFCESNNYFAKVYKKAQQVQLNKIVKLSMAKKIDTTMAIFSLKNVAGWRDSQEEKTGDLKIVINIIESKPEENAGSDYTRLGVYGFRASVAADN